MKVSVIMSARDDPIGTLMTARSAINSFGDLEGEVVIVDNSEDSTMRHNLKNLIDPDYIKEGKVVLLEDTRPCIFTAREAAVEAASGDLLILVDSHMLFGYDAIHEFVEFYEDYKGDDLGILYGPMCYHHKDELHAFHDRDPNSFVAKMYAPEGNIPIAFRGVPQAFTKDLFKKINGYGTLSAFRLSWGGGDTHLGIKSLLMGCKNWLVLEAPCIHIGPFTKDPYFADTFMRKDANTRWTGFLVVAYVLGGEELLDKRLRQITSRLAGCVPPENCKNIVRYYGWQERRWLLDNQKMSYEELITSRPWEDEKQFVVGSNSPGLLERRKKREVRKKGRDVTKLTGWRARIAEERSRLRNSRAAGKSLG